VTKAILALNRRTFSSLRSSHNYRLFFTGQVVSVTGTWMQRIAASWLILQLTHSPVAVGFLALATFLPFTAFGLFAGVFVDRLDARRTVIATQVGQMLTAAGFATVALGGFARPWHVYTLAALNGTLMVLDAPSRQALTYRMVGRGDLANAIALNSSLFNASRIFGPALGGVLIAAVGVGICFVLNAVSFLAVLAGLLAMREREFFPVKRHERPQIWRGTRDGVAFVLADRRMRVVLAVTLVVSTFCLNFNVLLPVLAKHTLHAGPQTYGVLSALFGGGALVGALLAAGLGRASLRWALGGSAVFCGLELVLAPLTSPLLAGLILFGAGIGFTVWTSNSNTSLQLAAPDHLRGRVVGLYYYAFSGTAAFGGLLMGWLSARGGTELAFFVAGLAGLAVTALAAASAIRERGARGAPAAAEPAPAEQLAA
jgi:MFS family permease